MQLYCVFLTKKQKTSESVFARDNLFIGNETVGLSGQIDFLQVERLLCKTDRTLVDSVRAENHYFSFSSLTNYHCAVFKAYVVC